MAYYLATESFSSVEHNENTSLQILYKYAQKKFLCRDCLRRTNNSFFIEMTFEELNISQPLIRAVEDLGFVEPMPVQSEVIPYLLGENLDLIALAQTGTGKTAAYGLPLLERLTVGTENPTALILSPTRELCLQIADDLVAYAKYLPKIHIVPVYGGVSIDMQIKALRRGANVVVATPGRLLDLLRRGALSLRDIESVVLDEADEMLNMGFSEDLKEILTQIPEERRLLLFSATMSAEMSSIARGYLKSPKEIVIGRKNEANNNISHLCCLVPARQKYLALKRIVDYYPAIYGIIFCRTRMETKEIAEQLIRDGYNADALHGDLSQEQRDRVMQRFRIANLQLLVATDVAARGLDVDNLTHVIHYGLPDDVENYTHRSGRTARAGKKGISIALCHLREKGRLRSIEKLIGAKVENIVIPTGKDICSKQLFHLADRLERVNTEDGEQDIEAILPEVCRKLDWIPKEDLIRRLMTLEFQRFFEYYRSAEEIEQTALEKERKNEQRGKRAPFETEEGMTRLFINFGKSDRLFPNKLIELINRCVPGRVAIGKIDLMQKFSFFDVDSEEAGRVIEELSQYEVEGRKIIVDYADAVSEAGAKEKKKRGKFSSAMTNRDKKRTFSSEEPKRKKSRKSARESYPEPRKGRSRR